MMDTKRISHIRKREAIKFSLLVFFFVVMHGCYRDSEEALYPKSSQPGSNDCDTTDISFAHSVKYIFLKNCALSGCHATGSATGGYTMDTYYGVKSVVLSGRLIGAITHSPGHSPMPKNALKLDACQAGKIKSWVNQGAKNN